MSLISHTAVVTIKISFKISSISLQINYEVITLVLLYFDFGVGEFGESINRYLQMSHSACCSWTRSQRG